MLEDKIQESINEDLDAFNELKDVAKYLIETKVPVIERAGVLRSQARQVSRSLSHK